MYLFPKKISEFMSLLEIWLVTVFMGLFLGFGKNMKKISC